MAAPGKVMFPENPSRQEYRAALRKARRKRRRQELARLRDSGLSREEEEDAFTEEQRLEEKLLESERQRLHEAWLLREQKAQEEFRRKKEREAAARKWQEERDRKLREEGEEQQRREREEEERKRQARGPRQEAVQRLLEPAGPGLRNGAPWRNPEPPPDPRTATERDRADCPFYSKTGACRFGDRCSRRHRFPSSSPTLLIKSMFTTFGMEQCRRDDYDPDASLEHSEEETYQHFLDFYDDVLPEFRNAGRVVQFTVSCNLEPHLRGNVYVQYQSEEECRAALSLFNGRWYAGRRLQCELCPVTRWKAAICGLFERHQCPRGKRCNFLHVFRNPNNEFRQAGGGTCPPPDRAGSSSGKGPRRRGRAGRREDYHARPRRRRSPGPARSYPRRRGAERKRRSSPRGEESRRRPSGSRAGPRSPSRGRKRGRGGGGGRGRGRGGRSRSSSGSRSRGRRRSGSRDRTTQSPKGK